MAHRDVGGHLEGGGGPTSRNERQAGKATLRGWSFSANHFRQKVLFFFIFFGDETNSWVEFYLFHL